ncbi:MAG: hypothetical protein LIQ30_02600 [Planctomycetes bacterium]|nr:hypothetical protein [Planctomycetota bacterium]MCD7896610.1 hypothetical protein [Planctomycetaceae bacterium]
MPLGWLTEDMVLWSAAALAFLLFVGTPYVTAALASRNRGVLTRAAKVVLVLVILDVAVSPLLVLFTAPQVDGRPCGLYLFFFSLFCYYSGKRVGAERGRRNVEERLDLAAFDSDIEVTDRLLESRLRFPNPEDVVASIKTLSASRTHPVDGTSGEKSSQAAVMDTGAVSTSGAQTLSTLTGSASVPGSVEGDDEVEVFEVEVEEVDRISSRS